MANYTKEQIKQKAEELVKTIITTNVKSNANKGILNLDRIVTTNDYNGNLFNEFLSMCQSIFSDLEFTCYVNYDTNTLSISWDNLDNEYTKDKDKINFNTFLSINNEDIKKYPEWLTCGIIIGDDTSLNHLQLNLDLTSSITSNGYPYYIVASDKNVSNYVNKALKIEKYIPYNNDYLTDIKTYEYIPFGEKNKIIKSSYYISGIEYIDEDMSISKYNNTLNNTYNTLLTDLNNEYNDYIKDGREPTASENIRMNNIMLSTTVIIPKQYNDAKLKLISNKITLSKINSIEYDNNPIVIDFNATQIISYVPTGTVVFNGKSYVTGGNISATNDKNDRLLYNSNPFIINWKSSELSAYTNQTINYAVLTGSQAYSSYILTSGEIDPWRNYYAKQYHDIAVNILFGNNNNKNTYIYGKYYQCMYKNGILVKTIDNSSNMPIPTKDLLEKIYNYVGNSTNFYIKNNYYICTKNESNNEYKWNICIISDDDNIDNYPSVYNLPEANENQLDKIYKYIGNTAFNYIKNTLYQCSIKDYTNYNKNLPNCNKTLLNKIYRYLGNTNYSNNHYYICTYNDYVEQFEVLPIPSLINLNKIYKYLGEDYTTETNITYNQNNYYKCSICKYENISTELPIAAEEYKNLIYKYIGDDYSIESDDSEELSEISTNHFYKCVLNSNNQYIWKDITDSDELYEWKNISNDDNLLYTWKDITNNDELYELKNITDNDELYEWKEIEQPQSETIEEISILPITNLYNKLNNVYKYIGESTNYAKSKSTYPLYQYFSNVLSSQINTALISNSTKTYNLNSNLNGLYSMVNETHRYTRTYNSKSLFLYKLISAYNDQTSIKKDNYIFENRSVDNRHAYVYYMPANSTNSKYNPIITNSMPSPTSNIFNNNPIYKYIGTTTNNFIQNSAYQCYKSNESTYYWKNTITSSGSQYTGKYTICIQTGAETYNYIDYSIMPIINYKSALIILNYLCKLQGWALTFKYYNHYYNSSGWKKRIRDR